MDNLSEAERKRGQLIEQIQSLYKNGTSIREITRITGKDRKTVRKYLHGDPDLLCRSNVRSSLDRYTDFIIKSIQSGLTQSTIAKKTGGAWICRNFYKCQIIYHQSSCRKRSEDQKVQQWFRPI